MTPRTYKQRKIYEPSKICIKGNHCRLSLGYLNITPVRDTKSIQDHHQVKPLKLYSTIDDEMDKFCIEAYLINILTDSKFFMTIWVTIKNVEKLNIHLNMCLYFKLISVESLQ